MTLSEYIKTEFGIVPDEVQLEQIREIVVGKLSQAEVTEIHSSLQGFRSELDSWFKEANKEAIQRSNRIKEFFKIRVINNRPGIFWG